MEQKSMTALVSAFSRAYHSVNNDVKIFNDSVAGLLYRTEYSQIEKHDTRHSVLTLDLTGAMLTP